MLIDFHAALPFLTLALAVLASVGNSLPLFVCPMGLYGWERQARIARNLAVSTDAKGCAAFDAAVGHWAIAGVFAACAAEHRLVGCATVWTQHRARRP